MNKFEFNIDSKEKNIEDLYKEIRKLNQNDININQIKKVFIQIQEKYKYYDNNNCDNGEYLRNRIKEIVKEKNNTYSFYISLIPVLIKACKIKFGYEPRDIQLLALLFFLFKDKNKGLIEQINTGEGKTIIIAFLAVIKALEGKKIDILTSSCVLAERDAKEMKDFYNLFGLSVDFCKSNNDKELKENKTKNFKCYDADIVYGDTLSFEADILRTNFMGITGRGEKRPFDCIIIDEIDNICLDNIKNITELLDDFHGYKFLEYIYLFIFLKLKEIDKELKKYIKKGKSNNIEENNYQSFILNNKNQIIEKLIALSKEELLDFNKLAQKNIIIPQHLHNFIEKRIEKWCESAYDAMYIYKENKQYIISNDPEYGFRTIKPVDFSNTGVIKENTVWTGLHQFLEIKEGLSLTEENINSCYMSNLTFFKKYISNIENNIYGLTGTLGTNKSQNALQILYNLNLLFIPCFKDSKFQKLPPKVTNSLNYYNDLLINEIIEIAINQQRAVLIIFKYIEEVNKLYQLLLNMGFPKDKLIKYTRNDLIEQQKFLNSEIQCGSIILSTNLSGRGTDIKISELLDRKNGLHVILTFVPTSERIEDQAFGRAGRKGENGSGRFILYSEKPFNQIIEERDNRENKDFTFLIEVYQKKINLFAEIFEDFSNSLKIIEKKLGNDIALLDIKEKWALFLVKHELTDIEKEYKDEKSLEFNEKSFNLIKSEYEKFKSSIFNDIKGEYNYSNTLILSKTKLVPKCDEAIRRSPILSLGAYMYRSFENTNNRTANYKNNLLFDFNNLERNLLILKSQFLYYEEMMDKLQISRNSDLFRQNKEKIEFVEELYSIIDKNMQIVKSYLNQNNYEFSAKRVFLSDLNFDKRYSKDIIEYFKDFGGICLFELSPYKKSFLSYIFSF